MKKSLYALFLLILIASAILIRCDCCITCPEGHIRAWLISPEDGAIIHTPTVNLIWGAEFVNTIQDESIILQVFNGHGYEYFLSKDHRSYQVGPLEPATTYYWYVNPTGDIWHDHRQINYGYEDWVTDWWSFTTADVLWESGHVYNPTPDSGAIGVSINPFLFWEVYNPELLPYDFDIYLGTSTDPPLLVSGLGGPSYTLSGGSLDHATLYYWRVEAYYDTDTIAGPLWEFTTDYPVEEDIFAFFELDARQAPSGYHLTEEIRARLDAEIALDGSIDPLQADSVFVEETKLNWNAGDQNYSYTEWSLPFIENGSPVDIVVYGNSVVPSLNTSIDFPACTLAIISPESFETVSITGFDVTWDGSECGGTVWLTILDGTDSTGVWKQTANDGSESLTADDLAPLGGQTGTYNLAVLKLAEENIDAPGYMPESLIRMRVFNVMEQVNIHSK